MLINFWYQTKSSSKNSYGCAAGEQVFASESDLGPVHKGGNNPPSQKGNNNAAWKLQGDP